MKFIELTLKDGLFQKSVEFSEIANIIYSQNNTSGKTTFLRAIFYALGYPIPSTKGIKFEKMEFWIVVENYGRRYKIYRHNSYLSVEYEQGQVYYSLPTDFNEVLALITGCDNNDILDNLLGAFYMDQEKGWTLLNRGKVIGNISFNVEALVRGLAGRVCNDEIMQLEAIKKQLKKYEYMFSVAEYQEAIYEAGEDIEYEAADEIIDRRHELLKLEHDKISEELQQIKSILRKNKLLAEYIMEMELIVQSASGEEIPVTKETLVGFTDNNEILTVRRETLASELEKVNVKIASLEKQKRKDEQLFKVQTTIEKFDSDIRKISVDAIATQRIINKLKRERQSLQKRIRTITRQNNDVVSELHNCISAYAKELGVDETYVSPDKDYIFTKDLKSLSGAVFHKIVFSFKMAYIKLIKEKAGIVLPIVLDSPSGREVKYATVEKMLRIVQRDFKEHQLIVASIYDYNLKEKKKIEFYERMFNPDDLIKIDE